MSVAFDGQPVLTQALFGSVGAQTLAGKTTSGTNRLAIVNVAVSDPGVTIASVTYGGSAMTLAASEVASEACAYIYWIANPPTTASNVVVTLAGNSATGAIGCYSVSGAHQTAPFRATATAAAKTVDCPSAAGDLVVDAFQEYNQSITPAGSQSQIYATNQGGTVWSGSSYLAATGSTTTMAWTTSGTIFGIAAGSIQPPASVDATPPVVSGASVNSAGTTLTVAFIEAASTPVLPASSVTGFTLAASGGAVTLSSTAISGTTFTATTSRTIASAETVTLAYTPGNITDSAATPNAMTSFSGFAVTNNSTFAGLAAGAAAFDSCGPAGGSPFIKVTAPAATGGTGSKTYQWRRSVNGGSYSNLSGATSLTVTDTTVSAGNTYSYQLAATDSASATATGGAASAQIYTGGALTGGGIRRLGLNGGF